MTTAPPNPAETLWRPATFLQRGAAVPFTSPALAGARVRPGPRGLELVLPHPAGARGVYVSTWPELAESAGPTLHDTLLFEQISALKSIGPREVRRVAQVVAATGVAGRDAQEAARLTEIRDHAQVRSARDWLLGLRPDRARSNDDTEAAIQRLAARLSRPDATVAVHIARLVEVYAGIGPSDAAEPAPCGRVVESLERLQTELTGWMARNTGTTKLTAALLLGSVAITLQLARRSLAEALARAADLAGLVRGLEAEAHGAGVMQELSRTEWLLDGWEQLCLVWRLAGPGGTGRVALAEMALIAPILPQEAEAWGAVAGNDQTSQQIRRSVRAYEDWRAGSAVFGLIARNEQIRALAA